MSPKKYIIHCILAVMLTFPITFNTVKAQEGSFQVGIIYLKR